MTQEQKAKAYDEAIERAKHLWSEYDEVMLNSIIATCQMYEQIVDSTPAKHLLEVQENWLKSIRPQKQWKPSEEQMKALNKEVNGEALFDNEYNDLKVLLEQLKAL